MSGEFYRTPQNIAFVAGGLEDPLPRLKLKTLDHQGMEGPKVIDQSEIQKYNYQNENLE